MPLNKFLCCFLLMTCGFSLTSFAEDRGDISDFEEELDDRDFRPLKTYLRTKEVIPLEEKDELLKISGDIRFEWDHRNEIQFHEKLLGGNNVDSKGVRVSKNEFDVKFNLYFDYDCGSSWGVAQLKFNNSAGVSDNGKSCEEDPQGFHGSGFCKDLCLKRAYMGYHLYECDDTYLDIIFGRNDMYRLFDSKIQFLSRFDGLLLKLDGSDDILGHWYAHGGSFIVDYRANHFAYVFELGLLDIYNSGFDLKYSFINWRKHGRNRCLHRDPVAFKYCNSQWTCYYHLNPEFISTNAYFYGAFEMNHCPAKFTIQGDPDLNIFYTKIKDENIGWYVGFTIGEVINAYDWALDFQYQYVEAQAIPDGDVSGIGRCNVLNDSFTQTARGNTNFRGWRIEALYAITNCFTIDTFFEYSKQIKSEIGGQHSCSRLQVETIYAF